MKRKIWMVLALALVISMFASFSLMGCKEEAAEETVEETTEEAAEETVEEATGEEEAVEEEAEGEIIMDDITISVTLHGPTAKDEQDVANLENMLSIAQKKYPNLKMEIEYFAFQEYKEQMLTRAAAGNVPDVLVFPGAWNNFFAKNGLALDLRPYLENGDFGFVLDDFADVALKAGTTIDGKIQFLSKSADSMVIAYNKKMFDDAGREYPSDDWTYADFAEAVEALTIEVDGETIYGFAPNNIFWAFMPPMAAYGFDAGNTPNYEYNVNSSEAVEALEMIFALYKDGFIMPEELKAEVGGAYNAFGLGKCAMTVVNPPAIPNIKSAGPDIDFDLQIFPAGPKGSHVSFAGGMGYGISKDSENIEAAIEFISAYFTDEGMLPFINAGGLVPPLKSMMDNEAFLGAETPPYNLGAWSAQLEEAITIPFVPWWDFGNVSNALIDAMYRVNVEGADVQVALDEAAELINYQITQYLEENPDDRLLD